MSEQPLDLRTAARILRRRWRIVGVLIALGLLAGAGYTVGFNRPMHASTALVVLPATITSTQTQLVIATSGPVLEKALPAIQPAVSLPTLRSRIQVSSVGTDVLSFTAQSGSSAQAQSMVNAIAGSYVGYVGTASNPVGWVPARVLAPAASATATELPVRAAAVGFIGALAGLLVGAVSALAIGRRDRKLRDRDAIADAIGVPVLASVGVPRSAGSALRRLLDSYEPPAADAWRLRHALGDLGLGGAAAPGSRTSLTVLSLSSDPQALALGPQLAQLAAADGIPTTLVVGTPDSEPQASGPLAALRDAATASRPGPLRLAVADRDDLDRSADSALSVVVCVVDDQAPRVSLPMRTDATWLGVTSGASMPEQLARVAASASAAGQRITGILVADPDPADSTTGLVPQPARSPREHLPTHLTGALR